jgi:hypothetical protein
MKCDRCQKETDVHIMSMFNTNDICVECKEKEEKDPRYKLAHQADIDAIKSGNYNFEGIGYEQI